MHSNHAEQALYVLKSDMSVLKKYLNSGIIILIDGEEALQYMAPMPRDPLPSVGWTLAPGFATEIEHAVSVNPAVHDGAIAFQIDRVEADYRHMGWSYRLFPPEASTLLAASNRGSAFHSSLAMSAVSGVAAVVSWSPVGVWLHRRGKFSKLIGEGVE